MEQPQQLREDIWDRTSGLDRATGMEQPCQLREDIWDMTSRTGPLGQDSWKRTCRTGQSGQGDSLDRSAQQAAWTGELGNDRDDRTART
jgi:hypothetical protein